MTPLDSWLKQATRHLSANSIARVRSEIQEHYEAAREAAISSGASAADADRLALAALGDAKLANRQYRKVLLTSAEARLLRDGNWEARAVCSRPWLKWLFLAVSVAALVAAAALFRAGAIPLACIFCMIGMGTGFVFAAQCLPVYTPLRGRIFRLVKYIMFVGALALIFGPETLKWFWLLMPVAWTEWMRFSIRRKLPVAQWPRQLYL